MSYILWQARRRGQRPVIHGRADERVQLHRSLRDAIDGHGLLVLISGEAGIGKTTLVDDLVHKAAQHSCLILMGGCYDLTTTPPYGPWADAIRSYQSDGNLPALPSWFGDLNEIEKLGSQGAIFNAARDFFVSIAKQQPLVIVLEDLHWADPASIDALRYLSRSISDIPVLICATYRDDEPLPHRPLEETIPVLVREGRTERLELRRWSESDTRALIATLYALEPADEERLAAHTHSMAEGNPFYSVELLRMLEEDQTLRPRTDGWLLDSQIDSQVPLVVRQVVERRLRSLSTETQEILQAGSVIGQDVRFDIWKVVCACDDEQFATAIEEAIRAHAIEELPDRTAARFRHALIRHAIYGGIVGVRVRTWHQRVAEALLLHTTPDPDQVARHFVRASDARQIEWLERAAKRAERTYSWRTAVERYEELLQHFENTPSRRTERGWLLARISDLVRYTDPQRGLAYAEEAKRIGKETNENWLTAFATFRAAFHRFNINGGGGGLSAVTQEMITSCELADEGIHAHWSGSDDPAWSNAAGALARSNLEAGRFLETGLSSDDTPLTKQWGTAIGYLATIGQFEEARRRGEALLPVTNWALSTVDFSDSTVGYADIKMNLSVAYAALGTPQEARAMSTEALSAYRLHRHHALVISAASLQLSNVEIPYFTDDPATRRELLDLTNQHRDAARGALPLESWTLPGEVADHALEGRWVKARETAERALADDALWTIWHIYFSVILSRLDLLQGRTAPVKARISRVLAGGPRTAPGDTSFQLSLELQRMAAEIALHEGNPSLASDWLEAHDRWLDWSGLVLGQAEGHLLWAQYQLLAGDLRQARDRAGQALSCATESRQPLALNAIQRFLGELDTREHHHDFAKERLASATKLALACRAPYELALTQVAQAELALAMRDMARADSLIDQARQTFNRLGAKPAIERAERLAAYVGQQRGTYPAGLTPREVEVLRLIAVGLSNREIADCLYLSVRTVERHISNIYGKIGVHSRVEAAAFAQENSLVSPAD